jgi:predicted transcriptional regulator
MASVWEEVESFHKFAVARLAAGTPEPSFRELLIEWQDREGREAVNQAIREGLEDVAAGRYEPVEKVMDDLRAEFGFDRR